MQQRLTWICVFLLACVGVEAFLPLNLKAVYSLRSDLRNQKKTGSNNVLLQNSSDDDNDTDAEPMDYANPRHIPSEDSIDAMLNQAISESITIAESELPSSASGGTSMNIMEDEGFKSEVAEIFDNASASLKSALEDIRKEQEEFAEESSAKSAARVESRIKDDQVRLDRAEGALTKIMGTVENERAEVEKALLELEEAQRNDSKDLLTTVASGGIIKQGALAGTILFTLRSITDLVLIFGANGSSHVMPALIQGALALAFAAYLFFA